MLPLRAQNIGFKTRDVLQLVRNDGERRGEVHGHGRHWGMKKEYYQLSLRYAKKAVKEMEAAEPRPSRPTARSPPSRSRRCGGKSRPPIALLREAYGLPEEH